MTAVNQQLIYPAQRPRASDKLSDLLLITGPRSLSWAKSRTRCNAPFNQSLTAALLYDLKPKRWLTIPGSGSLSGDGKIAGA